MARDPRIAYVASILSSALEIDQANLESHAAVTRFVNDPSCAAIQAMRRGEQDVDVQNTLRFPADSDIQSGLREVHIVKTATKDLDETRYMDMLHVSNMLESPAHALYQTIHHVYAPLLLNDPNWASSMEPNLQRLVGELDESLRKWIRKKGYERPATPTSPAPKHVVGILDPIDELEFWNVAAESKSSPDAAAAATICQVLNPLRSVVQTCKDDHSDWETVLDAVDTAQEVLGDLWIADIDPRYPQNRMLALLDSLSGVFGRYVQRALETVDLWHGPWSVVSESLERASLVCERWSAAAEELTAVHWQVAGGHAWKAGRYSNDFLSSLRQRLEAIGQVRRTHDQLAIMLASDPSAPSVGSGLKIFAKILPLYCNKFNNEKWEGAIVEYDRFISGAEDAVASRLATMLSNRNVPSLQQIHLFAQYRDLLTRPRIRKSISQQREHLLARLITDVQNLQESFDHRTQGVDDSRSVPALVKNATREVNDIVFARQTSKKIDSILSLSRTLLSDVNGWADLEVSCQQFLRDMSAFEKQQYDSWLRIVKDELKERSSSLGGNQQMMDIEPSSGKLRVHYSERFATLLHEVRQLSGLGFQIPRSIHDTCKQAQNMHQYASVLMQVANFHNTLEDQMIDSQKGMLLDAAKKFEDIVRNRDSNVRDLSWRSAADAEQYIDRLKKAADTLSSENRKLRKRHADVADKVVKLMQTDLLRKESEWKKVVVDVRSVFVELEEQGYQLMDRWKAFWDHQLYKALEAQFQFGLESLNENLPEIHVDMVFKDRRVQLRPSIETIREQYYQKMKQFIVLPTNFGGVGRSKIFRKMPDENAEYVKTVYRKAEELFDVLTDLCNQHEQYAVLGKIPDLFEHLESTLHHVEDYKENFQALEREGKLVNRIRDDIRVGCLIVHTQPLRDAIDSQLRNLRDILVQLMRRSVKTESEKVEGFLDGAKSALNRKLQSVEEISKASQEYHKLEEQREQIQKTVEQCDSLNRLIEQAGHQRVDIEVLRSRWAKFDQSFETHESTLREQVDELKSSVSNNVDEFLDEVSKFSAHWHQFKPTKNVDGGNLTVANAEQSITFLKERRQLLDELKGRSTSLVQDCEYFGLAVPRFVELDELEADMESLEHVWGLLEEYSSDLIAYQKEDWVSFRVKYLNFEDFIQQWNQKLRESVQTDISIHLRQQLDVYRDLLPVLKYVRGDGMSADHWADMFKLIGVPRTVTLETLTFGVLLEHAQSIIDQQAALKELNARAQGEAVVRDALLELKKFSVDCEFSLTQHECSGSKKETVVLIRDWNKVLTAVGDHQALLQSLKESPYFPPFAEEAAAWEQRLSAVDEYLHCLNRIQRKWVYLEPVFANGALPSEQARFNRADAEFRRVMADVDADHRVLSLAKRVEYQSLLPGVLDQLERCQKALNEFLEEKRSKFPRFYFIGDEDLLEILGQGRNPAVIQTHLKKLFAGINTVVFGEGNGSVVAIKSAEGEIVHLQRPVTISETVEDWLSVLDGEMQSTLQKFLSVALQRMNIADHPSQILCLTEQVHFTTRCEAAVKGQGLPALHKELQTQLFQYTEFDAEGDKVLELKVKALILDLIHHIDVVEYLMKEQTKHIDEWAWKKQLRFYATPDGMATVRMADAEFVYSYEYQGNKPKLVHTPLTDKCYLTLTQGIHLGYGGNPYGPAGTGKTESVKALGQAMGRQVLVFNCDEGIDFRSMGRIFIGLVKCGAWGCFDEFNRLKQDQLSAISQQIQLIQSAIKNRYKEMTLLGLDINVNPNAGIFVTMNPAGKGYGARSKLPDNLKMLFRSVAMTVPDNEQIAEVLLFAEGFKTAKVLAGKLVSIFQMSRQLLSPQQHYDWGLRALKTVLSLAGLLLRDAHRAHANSDVDETKLLLQALRLNTLSKLTFADTQSFNALVGDVFPGATVSDVQYEDVRGALVAAVEELHLQSSDVQIRKALQFYEALRQRIGVVLVGPCGTGKSTVRNLLQRALALLGKRLKTYNMNPKALPREKLLGRMDMDTREWFDGVLTASARSVVKESDPNQHSWIVCDGDIDPKWIESLNSVLDDNKLLTMPNGERIQFGSNVNFIFETHDLKFASPATVSRMGMIFFSEEDLDVHAIIQAWLSRQDDKTRMCIEPLVADFLGPVLDRFDQLYRSRMVIRATRLGVLFNALGQLHGENASGSKAAFALAIARGLGSYLNEDDSISLFRDVFTAVGVSSGEGRRVLEQCLAPDGRSMDRYRNGAPEALSVEEILNGDAAVPTIDLQRCVDMLKPWFDQQMPIILVGPDGCGKSLLVSSLLQNSRSASFSTLHCSAQTRAVHVMHKLFQECNLMSTNQGRVLRPRDRERLVLYLKDINLPKPDEYETTELISFLQQLLTYGGFYNDDLEWIGIENIQLVGTMKPASTVGRHELSTRFTSIVRVLSVPYPNTDQLRFVYNLYLKAVLYPALSRHEFWGSEANALQLGNVVVDVYRSVRKRFPADTQSHYIFSPRELSAFVGSLTRYNLQSVDLLDVVRNELSRVFRDRLVDTESRRHFDRILSSALRDNFGYESPTEDEEDVIFTALADQVKKEHGKSTMLQCVNTSDYLAIIKRGIQLFERESKPLNLVLHTDVIGLINRVERHLSNTGGSLLLVGRNGVGRRSVVSLLANMLHLDLFTLRVTNTYTVRDVQNDLRQVLQIAGVQNEHVLLFVEEHQIIDDSVLESINSLLSSSEIPGLWTQQELDTMLHPLREELSSAGFYGSPYAFFTSRVRRNLHVVLSMDPTHPQFQLRCQRNPSFFTVCNVLWLDTWSMMSYSQVPSGVCGHVFNAITAHCSSNEERSRMVAELTDLLLKIHQSCDELQLATPRRFVAFLNTYAEVFLNVRKKTEEDQVRLMAGLTKLNEAASEVDRLSREAATKQQLLSEKQVEADRALQEITASMEKAGERKKEIETIQEKLSEEEAQIADRQRMVREELSEVQPLLDRASESVGNIRMEQLAEIRSLKMPSVAIRDVLEGVLHLMGNFDTSWINMKRFLGQRGVKETIINFDARRITPEIRDKVEELLIEKGNSFEPSVIQRASYAAAPLAEWVKANVAYSRVIEQIVPLEEEMHGLEAKSAKSKQRLKQCEDALTMLTSKVEKMKTLFAQRTREAEELKLDLKKAEDTLYNAKGLLKELSGEQSRWNQQAKDIAGRVESLPRATMISAATIAYLGGQPEDARTRLCTLWSSTLGVQDYEFLRSMSSESEMLTWKAEGLPGDTLSMANAAVILNGSQQFPLIIDPSQQAARWLQEHLTKKDGGGGKSVEVTHPRDERFMNKVELSVRFGKTLVIEEVDDIPAVLFPLLRRDFEQQGPKMVASIGDKQIDYNEGFQLFLVTRNPNIELPPSAFTLVNVVNFSVTRAGLENQLLATTISHEQPELEEQKSASLRQEEEFKVHLAALENDLLQGLAASEGNLLENKRLIGQLNEIKVKAKTIADSLEQATQLQMDLDKQREVYRPFAKQGSLLYFLLQQLAELNHMYRFSLNTFLHLVRRTLKEPMPGDVDIASRITRLNASILRSTYVYATRSLLKKDRVLFGMLLVHQLRSDLFQDGEWDLFTGRVAGASDQSPSKQAATPEWVPADRQSYYHEVKALLPELVRRAELQDAELWRPWMRSPDCELRFPPHVGRVLSSFQRILLIKCFRPDRLQTVLADFARKELQLYENLSTELHMEKVLLDEASASEPVLFITTAGADPSQELSDIAGRIVGSSGYVEVAMGQGQTDEAIMQLRQCSQNGTWLCLKNLHLVVSWLPTLEKEFNMLKPAEGFRLLLTAETHSKFPTILLQMSLKITYEAPPGVKNNLLRTYDGWTDDFIGSGTPLRAQLFFALAWFHAIVQERRTYTPQGWRKFYEFSSADLRAAADVIDAACGHGSRLPEWATVYGLLENAVYGGRVDDDFDMRVLRTYLHRFFNNRVFDPRSQELQLEALQHVTVRSLRPIANGTSRTDYLTSIRHLSEEEVRAPALFGLPVNADRMVQVNQSTYVTNSLKLLSVKAALSTKFDRFSWSQVLAPILRLWDRTKAKNILLPPTPDSKLPNAVKSSPLCTFIHLQFEMAKSIAHTVNASLASLAEVLNGTSLLTSAVYADGLALLERSIPSRWSDRWDRGPRDPLTWIRDIGTKVKMMHGLMERGSGGGAAEVLRHSVELGDFFYPETFVNALRQETARTLRCAMDDLCLFADWTFERNSRGRLEPNIPFVHVEQVFLQGAAFEGGRLAEVRDAVAGSALISTLALQWKRKTSETVTHESTELEVPVYDTLDRERLIVSLHVGCGTHREKWILSGVALSLTP